MRFDFLPFRRNLVMRINHFAELYFDQAKYLDKKICFTSVRAWVRSANNKAKRHVMNREINKRKREDRIARAAQVEAETPSLIFDPMDPLATVANATDENVDQPQAHRTRLDNDERNDVIQH